MKDTTYNKADRFIYRGDEFINGKAHVQVRLLTDETVLYKNLSYEEVERMASFLTGWLERNKVEA